MAVGINSRMRKFSVNLMTSGTRIAPDFASSWRPSASAASIPGNKPVDNLTNTVSSAVLTCHASLIQPPETGNKSRIGWSRTACRLSRRPAFIQLLTSPSILHKHLPKYQSLVQSLHLHHSKDLGLHLPSSIGRNQSSFGF